MFTLIGVIFLVNFMSIVNIKRDLDTSYYIKQFNDEYGLQYDEDIDDIGELFKSYSIYK